MIQTHSQVPINPIQMNIIKTALKLQKLAKSLPIIKFIKIKNMSLHEIQRLTRQNRKLQEQIKSLTHSLSMLQNKEKLHEQLNRKWNKQKEFLNQQIKELRRRQEEFKYQKQETENRYFNVLKRMEDELEDRKTKYQKLQSKIQPLVDHDTVRLKILNEVEGVHFMELEEFKRKNNQLKDQILRLRRQNQVHKHEIENNRIDFEDEKRRLRYQMEDRTKTDHLNELSYEMCLELENRMRSNYDQARKQADYYKDKYFTSQKKYLDRIGQLEKQNNLFRQQLGKG